MASEIDRDESQSDGKATGGLRPTTAMLLANALAGPGEQPHFIHSLPLRFAETAIFLVAVIGAIALGLGITAYFGEHPYVVAFLVAYAGFRFSDLIVREDAADSPPREELSRRIAAQLPCCWHLPPRRSSAPMFTEVRRPRSSRRLDYCSSCAGCGSRWGREFNSDFSLRAGPPSIRCS